jgi:hypothetical protein
MVTLGRMLGHKQSKEFKNRMDENVANTEAYKCKSRLLMNNLMDERDIEE